MRIFYSALRLYIYTELVFSGVNEAYIIARPHRNGMRHGDQTDRQQVAQTSLISRNGLLFCNFQGDNAISKRAVDSSQRAIPISESASIGMQPVGIAKPMNQPKSKGWANAYDNPIKYKFQHTRHMPTDFRGGPRERDLRLAIENAFDLWSRDTSFRVVEVADDTKAEIRISFQVGDHGDSSPFDGPSNTLAHAFLPGDRDNSRSIDGDLHFDAAESWVFSKPFDDKQRDINPTAIHELGHSLGLHHSSDRSSIMYPTLIHDWSNLQALPQTDIESIKRLYGEPPSFLVKYKLQIILLSTVLLLVIAYHALRQVGVLPDDPRRQRSLKPSQRRTPKQSPQLKSEKQTFIINPAFPEPNTDSVKSSRCTPDIIEKACSKLCDEVRRPPITQSGYRDCVISTLPGRRPSGAPPPPPRKHTKNAINTDKPTVLKHVPKPPLPPKYPTQKTSHSSTKVQEKPPVAPKPTKLTIKPNIILNPANTKNASYGSIQPLSQKSQSANHDKTAILPNNGHSLAGNTSSSSKNDTHNAAAVFGVRLNRVK